MTKTKTVEHLNFDKNKKTKCPVNLDDCQKALKKPRIFEKENAAVISSCINVTITISKKILK